MTSQKSMLEFRDMGLGRIDAVFENKRTVGMIIEHEGLHSVSWMFDYENVKVNLRHAFSRAQAEDAITHWLFMALGAPPSKCSSVNAKSQGSVA